MPSAEELLANLADSCELLAMACRILADKEVCDSWGHISSRHPHFPETHFLLARSMPPALVTPSDIITYEIGSCKPVLKEGEKPRKPYKEIYIHSECYKRFSVQHVGSVVHFHSCELIPFGIAKQYPFVSIYHKSAFLGTKPAPIFEIRDHTGPENDLLITNPGRGRALAVKLDDEPGLEKEDKVQSKPRALVLMRGHGTTTVSPSVKSTVYHGIYAKENALILTRMLAFQNIDMDNVVCLGEGEVKRDYGETIVDRAWPIWATDAIARTGPLNGP